ncbi:sulfite exporter TauE/SafE family protein [Streptomyces sp. NPDC002776]
MGTNPAAASPTVHLAEIGTTLMSGAAHWRFGNVDWKVVSRIGVPGAAGAFLGATVLPRLSTQLAEPLMSLILLSLGVYVMSRFTFRGLPEGQLGMPLRKRFLSPLGLVAGFLDAGAAQGDRLDRHQRVPGGRRRQPRLPLLARLTGHRRRLGDGVPARRPDRRAARRLAGPPAPAPHPRRGGRRRPHWPGRSAPTAESRRSRR